MTREWTPNQARAIGAGAPTVCVAAGAGSGKTGVLVERYVRIVREGSHAADGAARAGVGGILVITFTEKATKEMKGRIVAELSRAGLHEQRRQIESAYISTIHGFCSRLLKENPFEAGVDPQFEVLDEHEAGRMLRDAVTASVEEAFSRGDEALIDLVAAAQGARLFDEGPRDPLTALGSEVQRVLARLRGAGWRQEQVRDHVLAGSASTARAAKGLVAGQLAEAAAEARRCADDLRAIGATVSAAVGSARKEVLDRVAALPEPDASAAWADLAAAGSLVRALATRCAALARRRGSGSSDERALGAFARMADALSRASHLSAVNAEAEEQAERYAHAFLSLVVGAWAAYDAAKRERCTLDNEDLQAEAVHLLATAPGVLRRYRRLFRWVMVDEFQDTNPLQMRLVELLHPLADEAGGIPDDERNALFVVGDAQQSIYAFRDADPTLFRAVEEHCRRAAASGIEGSHVEMADNFRARPDIVAFANYLFGQMWAVSAQRFVPLRAAVPGPDETGPSVELLLSADPTGRQTGIEAAGVARRVREMVEGGEVEVADPDASGGRRPIRWGDVAVLMRVFTTVGHFEQAFAAEGVPHYVVGGGRGYYDRLETRDIVNALTVIETPLDDVALAAALRSPMAGVALDTLFALRRCADADGPRASLYPAIPRMLVGPDIPPEEAAAVSRLYETFERLREQADRVPVAVLLDDLLASTEYDARVLVRPHGTRRLANVRKLVQMACAQPGHTLGEFIRRVRELERIAIREGDAPTEEEASNVVRFITIHKAKGLEFPVVVLAGMSRPAPAGQRETFVCDARSLAVGCSLQSYESAVTRSLREARERGAAEESDRLLYVAVTRARDRLVLSGAASAQTRKANWADTVFRHLGVLSAPPAPEFRACPGGLTLRVTPADLPRES